MRGNEGTLGKIVTANLWETLVRIAYLSWENCFVGLIPFGLPRKDGTYYFFAGEFLSRFHKLSIIIVIQLLNGDQT